MDPNDIRSQLHTRVVEHKVVEMEEELEKLAKEIGASSTLAPCHVESTLNEDRRLLYLCPRSPNLSPQTFVGQALMQSVSGEYIITEMDYILIPPLQDLEDHNGCLKFEICVSFNVT